MRCLVTGGAGFIGSHVARHCLALGHEVIVLDDLSGGFEDQVPPGAHFIFGSITDDVLVSELFSRYQFDYVYHLAAYAAEGLSHFIRRFNYTNNLGSAQK
jgi:UDP-glucose 4-epimerase